MIFNIFVFCIKIIDLECNELLQLWMFKNMKFFFFINSKGNINIGRK